MIASTRAFLITGLVSLPVAALFYLLSLLGVNSAWPAMVHLALFGWITAMILMVNYHTMPVFSGRDFPYVYLIWTHWGLFSLGVIAAVTGMLAQSHLAVAGGLLLQLIGSIIFTANCILLFRRGKPRAIRPPAPPIPGQSQVDRIATHATRSAGLALPLTLCMLFATRMGWISGNWTLAAEHLAALGWLMLMIVGVAYHVLPRFSGYGTHGPQSARLQLAIHHGALVLMVPALGFGWSQLFAAGAVLMAIALGLFAWTIWPALRAVQSQPSAQKIMLVERPR